MDGWVDGWMDGRKSRFKDCLQQSKITKLMMIGPNNDQTSKCFHTIMKGVDKE